MDGDGGSNLHEAVYSTLEDWAHDFEWPKGTDLALGGAVYTLELPGLGSFAMTLSNGPGSTAPNVLSYVILNSASNAFQRKLYEGAIIELKSGRRTHLFDVSITHADRRPRR